MQKEHSKRRCNTRYLKSNSNFKWVWCTKSQILRWYEKISVSFWCFGENFGQMAKQFNLSNIFSNIFQWKETTMRRCARLNLIFWHRQYPKTDQVLPMTSYHLPWHDMQQKKDIKSISKDRNKYCKVNTSFTNQQTTLKI